MGRQFIIFLTLNSQSYAIGKDKVGREFLDRLHAEFQKILDRKSNADQLLLFIMVILQRDPNVRTGSAIRKRIAHRLRSWAEGKIDMLVEDTEADLKKLLKSGDCLTLRYTRQSKNYLAAFACSITSRAGGRLARKMRP